MANTPKKRTPADSQTRRNGEKKLKTGDGIGEGAGGPIKHVVVLMMENRSFDHLFGYRSGVKGLHGDEYNVLDPSQPKSSSNPAFSVNNRAPFAVLAGRGPGHSINDTNFQLCNSKRGPGPGIPATNNGFVRNYHDELLRDAVPNPSQKILRVVMQSFAPSVLPSLNALADAFCICDNWYAEVPGPTQPNRFFMHAATSGGFTLNKCPITSGKGGRILDVPTIYNRLEDAGLTWATYEFDANEVREFSKINTKVANFKKFEDAFKVDVQQNTLPNYSFILPRFLNSKNATHLGNGLANSQHAPEDARYGDNLIAEVYEALRSNPDVWASSVLIVTYDEHGGFYDHVVPPSQGIPNPDGLTSPQPGEPPWAPAFSFDRLGVRVPAVIASPWIKAGRVDSTQYQHTSVLATLKQMFGLADFLTKRDASANTFMHLFSELKTPRTDTPVTLPRAPLPAIKVAPDHPAHPANLPLSEDQRDLLMKAYHLTENSHPGGPVAAQLPTTQGEAHDFIQARYATHFGPPGKARVALRRKSVGARRH